MIVNREINGSELKPARAMDGLAVTKSGALQLQVAAGSVTVGETESAIASAEALDWTSDSTHPKACNAYLIRNGTTEAVDLWQDSYLLDGLHGPADIPEGYSVVEKVLWFVMPAGETDLNNVAEINARRIV